MSNIADELKRLQPFADFEQLPHAWGRSLGTADLRSCPADFAVTEIGGFEPAGQGEHLYLRIRKSGQNTRWVAKRLAQLAEVPYRAVSFAGMKDRHAVTEQWFSIHMPGLADPDLSFDPSEQIEVLETIRHDRKLRPGQLSHNCFRISLRNCAIDDSELHKRMAVVTDQGVPNYFGPQRFGRQRANLAILKGVGDLARVNREQRGFALSALRGALFNGYLAARIDAGDWREEVPDDVTVSDRPRGTDAQGGEMFAAQRLPTGLLWGATRGGASATTEDRARDYFAAFPAVTGLLEQAGCKASRRVLRSRVGGLQWFREGGELVIEFALNPGSYATMVLRELIAVENKADSRTKEC
jgi:tRNA pseudouridine13 synthase